MRQRLPEHNQGNIVRRTISAGTATLLGSATWAAHAAAVYPTTVDKAFGMPIPPHNAPFGLNVSLGASITFIAIGLVVLGFAIYDARRTKTLLPVFVALSGVFCALPEIFIDVAGGCYWPYNDANVIYTFLGRPMTWYPVAAWFGFGAVLAYVPYALFLRKAKISWLWLGLAIACVFDIVVEECMLNVPGLYVYYGHQPLILFTKFPTWWMFTNIPGVFSGAALAWHFREKLVGWKGIVMFPLMPAAFLAVFGFAAMPASIVILGDYSWIPTQIGGVATAVLGLVASALIIQLLLNRNPLALSERVG